MPVPDHPHGPDALDHRHAPVDEISEGLRQWYDSCPCCMSQALPEVKQALDEERATASPT